MQSMVEALQPPRTLPMFKGADKLEWCPLNAIGLHLEPLTKTTFYAGARASKIRWVTLSMFGFTKTKPTVGRFLSRGSPLKQGTLYGPCSFLLGDLNISFWLC